MDPNEPILTLDETRDFKFQVPTHLHVRLHEHRLLTGASISATVSTALEHYFQQVIPVDAPIREVSDLVGI